MNEDDYNFEDLFGDEYDFEDEDLIEYEDLDIEEADYFVFYLDPSDFDSYEEYISAYWDAFREWYGNE